MHSLGGLSQESKSAMEKQRELHLKYGRVNPTKLLPTISSYNTIDTNPLSQMRSRSVDPFAKKKNKPSVNQSPIKSGNIEIMQSYEEMKRANDYLI